MIESQRVQKVQLGCGTLILIALIVLFFRNGGMNHSFDTKRLENEIQQLRSDVQELRQTVVDQTDQIKALKRKLDNESQK